MTKNSRGFMEQFFFLQKAVSTLGMNGLILVRILLLLRAMKTLCCALVRDGDELLVAVPENRTVAFYNYLRGFGFCFTLHSRGFCEDNVFCFHETENTERLSAIVAAFPLEAGH